MKATKSLLFKTSSHILFFYCGTNWPEGWVWKITCNPQTDVRLKGGSSYALQIQRWVSKKKTKINFDHSAQRLGSVLEGQSRGAQLVA